MPNEGFNPFPGFVHADSTCALQNVNTDGLDIGCLAKTPQIQQRAPGTLDGCTYWRLDETDPPLSVDGNDVLATYNSGMPLDGAAHPCTVVEPSAHSLRGTQRWIRLNIYDVASDL
jgi:hypothetical protein